MNIATYYGLQIEHYNGSSIEAYRLYKGDTYRLQLTNKGGFWAWKFSKYKDGNIYDSRLTALMACVGHLFWQTVQLSAMCSCDKMYKVLNSLPIHLASTRRLGNLFVNLDQLELTKNPQRFMDLLKHKQDGMFYAFYANGSYSGPYESKDYLLKELVLVFDKQLQDLTRVIERVQGIIRILEKDRDEEK